MISIEKATRYCCEPIEHIENYTDAVADKVRKWVCHHRDEIRILPSGMVTRRTSDELIENGRYWLVPANELIFILDTEHRAMHAHYQPATEEGRKRIGLSNKLRPRRTGFKTSATTKEKLRVAQTGKVLTTETKKKISQANLRRWSKIKKEAA